MSFRSDLDAYFGSPIGEDLFGKNLHGARKLRHTIPQVFLNTGLQAIGLYRLSRWFYTRKLVRISRAIDRINDFVCNIEIPGETVIGPRFQLHHPSGVVLAPEAVIGSNVMIVGASVTIGSSDLLGKPEDQPIEIGDNVIIAAGAKVFGPIKVGNNVRIGPHCILMAEDVPDGTTVVNVTRQKMLKFEPEAPAEPAPAETAPKPDEEPAA
jgi:serine O-acetyltransferase